MDGAKTRHEDNFGIPVDALYWTPPEGMDRAATKAALLISANSAANYRHGKRLEDGGSETLVERAGSNLLSVCLEMEE
jgi:hypothetical protein